MSKENRKKGRGKDGRILDLRSVRGRGTALGFTSFGCSSEIQQPESKEDVTCTSREGKVGTVLNTA